MRTSINELVDRRGGAMPGEELESVLNRARRLLADVSTVLELESDRLFNEQFDETNDDRLNTLKSIATQMQKARQSVIDLEARLGVSPLANKTILDLEAARDEILRRLDCVALG